MKRSQWCDLYRRAELVQKEMDAIYKEAADLLGCKGRGQVNADRDKVKVAVKEIVNGCEPVSVTPLLLVIDDARMALIELWDCGEIKMDDKLKARMPK